jgi:hypothetical protein
MAIIITTERPNELLGAIKTAIDNDDIITWSYDDAGDFTHTAKQWINEAWLRPKIYAGELRLGIVPPQGVKVSTEIYAIYHGRFIEMILAHFDKKFTNAMATALLEAPDIY